MDRQLLSGDEAVALAALHAGVALGTGYPGTPSTEILEAFDALGGRAQWAPNEKVALEVGLGAAFGSARAIVTMKHVGLNVAADPLFTAAYTGVDRRADRGHRRRPGHGLLAERAGQPPLRGRGRAADDRAVRLAGGLRLLLRGGRDLRALADPGPVPDDHPRLPLQVDRRRPGPADPARGAGAAAPPPAPHFEHDITGRVMIPANARPAHRRLRAKLAEIAAWGEEGPGRPHPAEPR